jgi:branched-chain amino acid transport system permease protein
VRAWLFLLICAVVAAAVFGVARLMENDYVFFAGYVVLQYIVLATAWNILGGYTGYVNFGSAAFFALGAYTSVFLHKAYPLPVPLLMLIGGIVSGIVGFGTGYLTLRLRGAFFAIATLALAVVLQTLIVNWTYVGGARGAYVIRPESVPGFGNYVHYLFLLMLALAVVALTTARTIERSALGYGFAAIRDDELAAEASGVPTLQLKLIATTISGALMGMAGAPFPYYIGYVQPSSAFALDYAVNSIAMPMIGGTTNWIGPLVGAILLGTLQQVATVTISSAVNLLIVGLLIIDCVILAPYGIVGLVQGRRTSSNVVADPAVFAVLYVLNTAPILFLHEQGASARPLELIFWAILVWVASSRGRITGWRWLVALPIAAAILNSVILSVLLVLGKIPGLGVLLALRDVLENLVAGMPGVQYLPAVAALLNVACLACGLLAKRRDAAAPSPAPAASRAP